jgi:hypothetical protein
MRAEREKYLDLLLRHQNVTERALDAAARAARKLPRGDGE